MGKVVSDIAQERQEEIAAVLLQYLINSADVINQPGKFAILTPWCLGHGFVDAKVQIPHNN